MAETGYKTIENLGQVEIIEKKSRFIGNACPVLDEQSAKDFIAEIKKQHADASHSAYAYMIGDKDQIQKQSDDKEPSGTAGKPILDVIKGNDLKNVVVVVTRYFGGVLLGTGGLVHAYGSAASEAVKAAGVIERKKCVRYSIVVGYQDHGKLQYEIKMQGIEIEDTRFGEAVEMMVIVEIQMCEQFEIDMMNISSGKASLQKLEQIWRKK